VTTWINTRRHRPGSDILVIVTIDIGQPAPGRTQLHVWVDADVAEWLRLRAFMERRSRNKIVEAILRDERARKDTHPNPLAVWP